jgi:hypothetical protein
VYIRPELPVCRELDRRHGGWIASGDRTRMIRALHCRRLRFCVRALLRVTWSLAAADRLALRRLGRWCGGMSWWVCRSMGMLVGLELGMVVYEGECAGGDDGVAFWGELGSGGGPAQGLGGGMQQTEPRQPRPTQLRPEGPRGSGAQRRHQRASGSLSSSSTQCPSVVRHSTGQSSVRYPRPGTSRVASPDSLAEYHGGQRLRRGAQRSQYGT